MIQEKLLEILRNQEQYECTLENTQSIMTYKSDWTLKQFPIIELLKNIKFKHNDFFNIYNIVSIFTFIC